MVKLLATPFIGYELEISQEKIFMAMFRPTKSMKFFNLENFRLYGTIFRIILSFQQHINLRPCYIYCVCCFFVNIGYH